MIDPRLEELGRLLARIRIGLRDEADIQGGQQRIYGRLHESGRAYNVARYSPTGQRLEGAVHFAADCSEPDHGRCTHNDGGSWRPAPGATPADALVGSPYEVDPRDGLRYCRFPYRRAMRRLWGQQKGRVPEGKNHYDVLTRLLEGLSVRAAWTGLGQPADYLEGSLAIARNVEAMATQEAWSTKEVAWIEKSEAQQRAETEGSASAVA